MVGCWCGNTAMTVFNAEYGYCAECGTLVSQVGLSAQELNVDDDETSFYGKQYWLDHQNVDLGFPDIYSRSRRDLTERNLHWLEALLKYRAPGGNAVELGCAHGSFVALMQWTGWNACGVEMSPWVVEFGRKTFGVPLYVGPVENVGLAPASLDVIALMDVLEHLPDPLGTMRHCMGLLQSDGMLLIQTPQFREDMQYDALVASGSPFLEQLKADEHLYLFSERAVRLLFERLGAPHLAFEPAIFAQYDMFFAASRSTLVPRTPAEVEQSLLAPPARRLPLALLDLRERELRSEADRFARGEQIETLTGMVHAAVAREQETARRLGESDTDRAARGEQIETLTRMVHEAVAREQETGRRLAESDVDRAARGEQIHVLTGMVHQAVAREQDISRRLDESDADRAARGEQIQALTRMIHEAPAREQDVARRLAESDADRAARGEQIDVLTRMVHEARAGEADAAQRLRASEADRADLRRQLEEANSRLRTSEVARAEQDEHIRQLNQRVQEITEDDIATTRQASALAAELDQARAALDARMQRSAALAGELHVLLARPAFQWLARMLRWREAGTLQHKLSETNE